MRILLNQITRKQASSWVINIEPETVDEAKIRQLCKELHELGPRHVIMSGVPHQTEAIVAVYDGETDELQLVSTSLVPVKLTARATFSPLS